MIAPDIATSGSGKRVVVLLLYWLRPIKLFLAAERWSPESMDCRREFEKVGGFVVTRAKIRRAELHPPARVTFVFIVSNSPISPTCTPS